MHIMYFPEWPLAPSGVYEPVAGTVNVATAAAAL